MKTVIFCGGRGTRIREVTDNAVPKPLVPIGKFPILWHIMNHYAYYDFKDFVFCLGYLGWQIKSYFLNFKAMINNFSIQINTPNNPTFYNHKQSEINWKTTFVETGENAQTGARVRKIRAFVEDDPLFMLTYGDGLSDVNIQKLVQFHKKHGKIGTVTGVRPSGRFGEIEVSNNLLVSVFHEKPQTSGGRINGGFFVFDSKRLWDYLPEGDDLNFEVGPLRELANDGELMMFPHDGFWQPMDTYREYKLLNDIWEEGLKNGNIPWPGLEFREFKNNF